MADILSRRAHINGLDIHYFTGGQGEPLIIVHGGSNGAISWIDSSAVLSRKYKVYIPDMPGFGSSQPIKGVYHIPEMVDFLDKFAQSMGLKRFNLMGHSLGGGIALHYALKYPQKISKLVLVSSLCLGREIAWWVRLFSTPLLCRALGKAVVSIFRGIKFLVRLFGPWEIIAPVTQTSIEIGSCICTLTQQTVNLLNRLPQVLAPTLVLWGDRDRVVPSAQAYAAAGLIPDCRVKVFDHCGHSVYRDRLPEFSSVLAGFLG